MGCTFLTSFLCNFQYLILGWPTLVLGPSIILFPASLVPRLQANFSIIICYMIVHETKKCDKHFKTDEDQESRRQRGLLCTICRFTLWPTSSRMLLMPYLIIVGLQEGREAESNGLEEAVVLSGSSKIGEQSLSYKQLYRTVASFPNSTP